MSTLAKQDIERLLLEFYAGGKHDEFFFSDKTNTLKGFTELKSENHKKIKDVAVSLVRADFLKGIIHQDKEVITVTIKGITKGGQKYLSSMKK